VREDTRARTHVHTRTYQRRRQSARLSKVADLERHALFVIVDLCAQARCDDHTNTPHIRTDLKVYVRRRQCDVHDRQRQRVQVAQCARHVERVQRNVGG
jgi:hypothetical protein